MSTVSDSVSSYLETQISNGSIPGAQYLIAEDLQIIAEDALGLAVVEPEKRPVTLDTIYDLASLTKPLVTALLVLIFVEKGLLALSAPLARYLKEFNDKDKREITLFQLLTHTSGLPNWRPLYFEADSRSDVPAAISRILLEPETMPAADVVYSDLNYILLGFVLERICGERLDVLARHEIFEPLGLLRTMFNPPETLIHEIAATERGQEFEFSNAIADVRSRSLEKSSTAVDSIFGRDEVYRSCWRKGLIWGGVHDGNANFMNGVAGHAGLFSTARDAFIITNQVLPGSKLLKPETLPLFSANLTPGYATSRSIAWILAATPDCSAGPALPPSAFGHNGFTGTSIWIDPARRRVLILLTNRVHPTVHSIDMREIRRRFNTLSVETLTDFESTRS